MRSQARGLAEAVVWSGVGGGHRDGGLVIEKVVGLRAPWSWLPGHLAPSPLSGLARDSAPLTPPWPDVLVTCGRRSTALSIAIRRLSAGRTLTVHVQNPLCPPSAFDLVVPMRHDAITGANVFAVDTALHGVTAAKLAAEADAWRARFALLPTPRIGLVLGGSNRQYRFSGDCGERLLDLVARARTASGAGLFVTPSRRTDPVIRDLLAERFANDPSVYVWNGEGDNPYIAILALADRLVVTSDSVSMVSEALATGHPVETFDLEGEGRRHGAFIENLVARGLVRRFEGSPTAGARTPPVDATRDAADAVRRLLAARRRS
jgi:hypothetical protein